MSQDALSLRKARVPGNNCPLITQLQNPSMCFLVVVVSFVWAVLFTPRGWPPILQQRMGGITLNARPVLQHEYPTAANLRKETSDAFMQASQSQKLINMSPTTFIRGIITYMKKFCIPQGRRRTCLTPKPWTLNLVPQTGLNLKSKPHNPSP